MSRSSGSERGVPQISAQARSEEVLNEAVRSEHRFGVSDRLSALAGRASNNSRIEDHVND